MSKEKSAGNGLGLGTILFLIFLTLKLAEIGPVQYWSWWWVTAPLWIPLVMIFIIVVILSIVWVLKSRN
jgi:hypothetical protein